MPQQRFQTTIRKARENRSGLTVQQVERIANRTKNSIQARMQNAINAYDVPSMPLAASYAARKVKGQKNPYRPPGKPVRDWTLFGITMRSLKVLEVSVNRAVIGFLPTAYRPGSGKRSLTVHDIVRINQRRERQFGVSPNDRKAFLQAVHDEITPSAGAVGGVA